MNTPLTSPELIDRAVSLLRSGGLVAFPTETVYGLGADATNRSAIRRIFAVKGRPATNPLIVHVADVIAARRYALEWPEVAERLTRAFWPGPLTIVLRRSGLIVGEATAQGDTVGLRAPDHPVALALLRAFDGPLAAPSANRSNRISPTTADHVRRELGSDVDQILDGGPCSVGIESTVLDLTTSPPRILRPGHITAEQIARVVGDISQPSASPTTADAIEKSPGRHAVHYAPRAPAFAFADSDRPRTRQWAAANLHTRAVFILMRLDDDLGLTHGVHRVIEMPRMPSEYARALYAALHDADNSNPDVIWIELPPANASWSAIHDRINRAVRSGDGAPEMPPLAE